MATLIVLDDEHGELSDAVAVLSWLSESFRKGGRSPTYFSVIYFVATCKEAAKFKLMLSILTVKKAIA
jgi:hypothetical protein